MYTLDTNAVIYYAQGDGHAVKVLDHIFKEHAPLYLSTISEIELFSFSFLQAEEAKRIEQFLSAVAILPVDSRVARLAASLRREHGTKTLDSAIAATALLTSSTLVTHNIRDFKKIFELSILAL